MLFILLNNILNDDLIINHEILTHMQGKKYFHYANN